MIVPEYLPSTYHSTLHFTTSIIRLNAVGDEILTAMHMQLKSCIKKIVERVNKEGKRGEKEEFKEEREYGETGKYIEREKKERVSKRDRKRSLNRKKT